MNKVKKTPVSIDKGEFQHIDVVGGETLSVVCSRGTAWITVAGDLTDYLVTAGQTLEVKGRRGSIVVGSLTEHVELDVRSA